MTSDYTDFNFIYIDGNVGDVIHAYLEDESDCTDTLTLEAKQSAAEVAAEAAAAEETATEEEVAAEETTTEETTIQEEPEPVVQVVPVCTTVDIQPDSYLVPNDQNSAELTIMVAADADWSGDLTLKSSNDSSIFLNNVNKLKSNPTYISVSGASTTVSTTLKNLTVGDMVTAYIEGEENCTDTLTLEAEPLTAEETVVQEVFADLSPDGENSTDNLTRAEAVKILMVLSGKEGNGTVEHFTDVSPNDWFYDYYVAAEKAGIVHGTLANPNKPITRGDLMVYMARTAEQTLYGWDETDIPFPDLKKSDYYTYAIIIGYQTFVEDPTVGTARVFEGYSNGTSGAKNYIARSEAMTLALRFYLAWYANQ